MFRNGRVMMNDDSDEDDEDDWLGDGGDVVHPNADECIQNLLI